MEDRAMPRSRKYLFRLRCLRDEPLTAFLSEATTKIFNAISSWVASTRTPLARANHVGALGIFSQAEETNHRPCVLLLNRSTRAHYSGWVEVALKSPYYRSVTAHDVALVTGMPLPPAQSGP